MLIAILAGVGSLLTVLLVWGLAEPYWLVVEEREAELPHLPEEWEGCRVALLADLHLGMPLGNAATALRAVRSIAANPPELVLVAGDFVHDSRRAVVLAARLLRQLTESGIPVYAVLGNHDFAMPTKKAPPDRLLVEELRAALRDAGVCLLHNTSVPLRPRGAADGRPLHLVGVGPHIPGEDDVEAALSGVPEGEARLVLMHHPSSFESFPPGTAPVALAGHTHGGQVRLPFAPLWRYLTYIKEIEVYMAGWIASGRIDGYGAEGNSLYVSRGIGCSVIPLRISCPPEITLITLRAARSKRGTVRSAPGVRRPRALGGGDARGRRRRRDGVTGD